MRALLKIYGSQIINQCPLVLKKYKNNVESILLKNTIFDIVKNLIKFNRL